MSRSVCIGAALNDGSEHQGYIEKKSLDTGFYSEGCSGIEFLVLCQQKEKITLNKVYELLIGLPQSDECTVFRSRCDEFHACIQRDLCMASHCISTLLLLQV